MTESFEPEVIDGDKSTWTNRDDTLIGVLNRLVSSIVFPDPAASTPLLQRIKTSVAENGPRLPEASRNSGREVLCWTRKGSPLRALLVISVGTVTLLTLTGLLVFILFFFTATVNAIVVSLLMTLAAAGGFLTLFFACVTAIYIGALSIAAFVISTATFSAIVAALIVTGWVGFFWIIWLAAKKSLDLAKHSLQLTGSVLHISSSGHHIHHHEPEKVD